MSDEDKFDYRFKALPASLRITTNIIAYQKKKKKKNGNSVPHT